ncbi:MAG: hypothetical protein R3D62_07610 [Xanthobacteraceae bacterium]
MDTRSNWLASAQDREPPAPTRTTEPLQYFIPVCLYPHTQYRTGAGVTALFEKYQLQAAGYLIVIADRLLVLDRLVTGRYWSVNSAFVAARREAEQIGKLIKRIARKTGAHAKGRVVFWDEIAEAPEFSEFAKRLRSEVLADDMLSPAIEEFVRGRVERFGLGAAPEHEHEHEREYILSEVCMSVYCTEVLSFRTEVWERPPASDAPDPLNLLYRTRTALVERVTGHPVKRVLDFLYPDD